MYSVVRSSGSEDKTIYHELRMRRTREGHLYDTGCNHTFNAAGIGFRHCDLSTVPSVEKLVECSAGREWGQDLMEGVDCTVAVLIYETELLGTIADPCFLDRFAGVVHHYPVHFA